MPAEINGREMTDGEMIIDGRRRLDEIRNSIRDHLKPDHGTYNQPPLLHPRYTATVHEREEPGVGVNVKDWLRMQEDPMDGYRLVLVSNNEPMVQVAFPYQNYVHESGRAILCMNNWKSQDHLPQEQQMKWTDIMAASCVQALSAQNRTADTMVALASIWRVMIDNGQTQRLIQQLASRNPDPDTPFEIRGDEPLFFALVASDHGRAIASLLRDYPWMFGFKTMVSAVILPAGRMPSLYWRLEIVIIEPPAPEVPDTPEATSSPVSRKEARKPRKEARKHRKTLSKESNISTD